MVYEMLTQSVTERPPPILAQPAQEGLNRITGGAVRLKACCC